MFISCHSFSILLCNLRLRYTAVQLFVWCAGTSICPYVIPVCDFGLLPRRYYHWKCCIVNGTVVSDMQSNLVLIALNKSCEYKGINDLISKCSFKGKRIIWKCMRVIYKIMSPLLLSSVVLKTHVQFIMFMTTALKAFFKFCHSIEDEQKG